MRSGKGAGKTTTQPVYKPSNECNSYTVSYDSKSHCSVLFQRWGSIWPKVLPYCIWNAVLDLLLQELKNRGIINLTVSDKGHTFINLIMGFLMVSRLGIALSRYQEVRKHVGAMYTETKEIVQQACVYSLAKGETQVSQKEWRNNLAYQMMVLLRAVQAVLDYPSSKDNAWTKLPDADLRKEIEHKLLVATKRYHHGVERGELEENIRVPDLLVYKVRAIVQQHYKVFQNPFIIHQERALQTSVDKFVSAWTGARYFLTTPHPFPLVQMTRTFLFFYVFTLPFALLSDVTLPGGHAITIFFLTFGYLGIETVAMELDNPFGDDQNDWDNLRFAHTVFEDIYLVIEDADGEAYAQKLRNRMEDNVDCCGRLDNIDSEKTPLVKP